MGVPCNNADSTTDDFHSDDVKGVEMDESNDKCYEVDIHSTTSHKKEEILQQDSLIDSKHDLEKNTIDAGNNLEEYPDNLPAPDGDYGWVIVFASWLMFFLLGGWRRSYSLILIYIRERYGTSAGVATWIGGGAIAGIHMLSEYQCVI